MRIVSRIELLLLLAACGEPRTVGASASALEERAGEEVPGDGDDRARPAGLPEEAVVVEPRGAVVFAFEFPVVDAPTSDFVDADGDGSVRNEDPDDADPGVRPRGDEQPCNGFDEDLDGLDSCPADIDGDGATQDVDCDDRDSQRGPLAREVRCDGRDQNCDGHDLCDRDHDGVTDWDDPAPDDPARGARQQAEWESSL